jgi:uncharacterized membrane protein YobD (UPF0266 family)
MEYKIKSSLVVKFITFAGMVSIISIVFFAYQEVFKQKNVISGIILFSIIIVIIGILFLRTPKKIILLPNNNLIIKKQIGEIEIKDITALYQVSKIPAFSIGTKGFMGFQGKTMDNYSSYIMDEKEIIAIETKSQKYLISCKHSKNLIQEWKALSAIQ